MSLNPIEPVCEAAVNAVAGKVGNLVSTIWDYSLGLVANIIFLSWKAEEVAGEMKRLQEQREDLHNQVKEEVRKNSQTDMAKQLSGWMSRVSSLAEDASNFQRSFEDGSLCVTRFRLGYEAVELLRQAKRLTEEGKEFLADPARLLRPRGPDPVEQVPSDVSRSTLVGGKEALCTVERHILDDGVGIIGIFGMGGVGKTSLLKIINNEFLGSEACRDRFEVAIWVTVSRDVQISHIQKSIANRLGLKLAPSSSSTTSITWKDEVFGVLSKKRFVLLLDDVWERLDLVEIGIPLPKISNNKSKILFTTRSNQICGHMDADKRVNVTLLDDRSSWDLFLSKFGRDAPTHVLHDPDIRQLAQEVVRRCGRLPIALITVGRAMSNARTADDWEDAIRKLDQCDEELLEGACEGLTEVLRAVDDGGGADSHHLITTMPPFPKLKRMDLISLPSLTSISTVTLPFPCLECLDVIGCPLLRRLPFGPQSAGNLQIIMGEKAWWDGLEWEDDHAHQQGFFSSKFQQYPRA